ncbi:MAG: glycine zipper 2TM domain-containing protein [Gammaproteobacteria bacterium]|nr:glycine zipper 2TM domain-containing protein [Gammaproteobacteria bacterium]MCP4474370.1 glycine zipper 2TM domain-containing protein [Gammaproteobacteria bacterium]
MMKRFSRYFLLGVLGILPLAGCETPPTHQQVGTVVGAGAGALIGSQFGSGSGQLAATGVGAVLGGVIGSQIGTYMDRTDDLSMQQTLDSNPIGQPTEWNNPDNHQQYMVVPTRTFIYERHPCRDYTVIVTRPNGGRRVIHGTACRESNGEWRAVHFKERPRTPYVYLPPGY